MHITLVPLEKPYLRLNMTVIRNMTMTSLNCWFICRSPAAFVYPQSFRSNEGFDEFSYPVMRINKGRESLDDPDKVIIYIYTSLTTVLQLLLGPL